MNIIKQLTSINRTIKANKQNLFIVIHYVGAVSSSKNNAMYFQNEYRGASANYFVDDNDIYQVVEDSNVAWHCGDPGIGTCKNKCYNSNSIGIELCCFNNNGKLDISDKTINNAVELTRELMKKYNIPIENVIRHYDVTKKNCPAPFVEDTSRWENFKCKILNDNVQIAKVETNNKNDGDEKVREYKNGSTPEPIYSDSNLTNRIGSLNPYEKCDCFGIQKNRAVVLYKVDNKNNYKIGFAKWLGGIK